MRHSQKIKIVIKAFALLLPLGGIGPTSNTAFAANYYIVPSGGSDSGPGSLGQPFASVQKALDISNAGDNIYLRGGTYDIDHRLNINKFRNGTSSNPITLQAYQNEQPILDFATNPNTSQYDADGFGLRTVANWWHFKDLTFQNAPWQALHVLGSNNVFERLVLKSNGGTGIDIRNGAANNLVLNTDAYDNFDVHTNGENADGFAVKFDAGPGNIFRGTRAWNNSDDGYDFWMANEAVTIEDSWAFRNGVADGNGNGFKLGQGTGAHQLIRVAAWKNSSKGVDYNVNGTGVTVRNSTVWDSGTNYHFNPGSTNLHLLQNNVSLAENANHLNGTISQNNTWNGISVDTNDFLSLDPSIAEGARLADGELPVSGFLRLAPGSNLIDAGLAIGLPFKGVGPDLGAFESSLFGDFNSDGTVDAADYTVWRDHEGNSDDSVLNGAGDGVPGVGSGDYDFWVAEFSNATSSSAVPEPASAILLGIGSLLLLATGKRF